MKYEDAYLKAYANASEARRELGAYLWFYNDQRPHQPLGYRITAEVIHGDQTVKEEKSKEMKRSPGPVLTSYTGAMEPSPNSALILPN